MKRLIAAMFLAVLVAVAPRLALAEDYRYMSGAELEQKIKANEKVDIVDIQVEPEYQQHHIKGATPTYSYPVKSDEDKAKLDKVIPALKESSTPVVVVCPRGLGGAERTYSYMKEKGIDVNRLFILEKGQAGWDRPELTETGK